MLQQLIFHLKTDQFTSVDNTIRINGWVVTDYSQYCIACKGRSSMLINSLNLSQAAQRLINS